MPQISAVSFFCFCLIILSSGYFLVEIIRGDKYYFQEILERNKRSLFDRILHYTTRGIIINVGFSILFKILNLYMNKAGDNILTSLGLDDVLYSFNISHYDRELLNFSVGYFMLMIFTSYILFAGIILIRIIKRRFKTRKNKVKKI